MEAFASFFRILKKKHMAKYYILTPKLLTILPLIKEKIDNRERSDQERAEDQDNLTKAFMALIDLATVAPKMFKNGFSDLVRFCVSMIQDKDMDKLARQNGLELLATFADYAPSMCRKDQGYTENMVTQCLSFMTDIGEDDDDESDWLDSDDVSIV